MKAFLILLFLTVFTSCVTARTYIVQATYNTDQNRFFYVPADSFFVNVGDTIDWKMDFTTHTLLVQLNGTNVVDSGGTSTIPPGGIDIDYIVSAVGTYIFSCTQHPTMISSFRAVASGVSVPAQPAMEMEPIYPNPAAEQAMVHFTLVQPQHVMLRIYDAEGTLVQTPVDETMTSGFHMLMIHTKSLAAGSYQYVLEAGGAVLRRSAIVIK